MSTLNIRHLTYLDAAVRHGSLNKAASRLGVSQPALSKAIKSLEAQLGTVLILRTSQGVSPTPAGKAALRRGQLLLEQHHSFFVEAGARTLRRNTRTVRVGCGPSEATRLLPMAIASLKHSGLSIDITVLYGLNEDLMPMVKRGDVDFALSSVPRNLVDPDLDHRVLLMDRAAVVASTRHPLADGRPIEVAMLLDYPWVLARRRELERRALDELFLRAGLRPPEAMVETTSADLMKSLLLHGEHLSFLPCELIYWEQQAGQLTCLDVTPVDWERQIGITFARHGRKKRAVEMLVRQITLAARSLKPAALGP